MKHLVNIISFEDLKKQYRAQAMKLHPDMGGSEEAMQELNNEYDILFPIWKSKSAVKTNETAASDRHNFYTHNGWAGKNYNIQRSTKDIANIMRTWLKERFSDCKFSVTSTWNTLDIVLMEAPYEVLRKTSSDYKYGTHSINHYWFDREENLTKEAHAMFAEILEVMNSYRMDDSDGMIDYFHTNFYPHVAIGKGNKPFQVVARKKKASTGKEEYYTTKEIKTRKVLKVEVLNVIPNKFKEGMYLRPKAYFTGQIHKDSVYKVTNVTEKTVVAYWMGRKMKNLCTGMTPGNHFSASIATLKDWIARGSVELVELVEATEEYEVEVTKKRKVKDNAVVA